MAGKIILVLLLVLAVTVPHATVSPWLHRRDINRTLKIYLDTIIPLRTEWIWMYFFTYPFNAVVIGVFFLLYPLAIMQQVMLAYIGLTVVFVLFWILFPIKVERVSNPHLSDISDIRIRLLNKYQSNVLPYCAFPSLHIGFTYLSALFALQYFGPIPGCAMFFAAIAISASVLCTKQHYILDVIAGLLVTAVFSTILIISGFF